MSRKGEAREARKQRKLVDFAAAKHAVLVKLGLRNEPKIEHEPSVDRIPHVAPHLARQAETLENTPKAVQDGSRFGSRVTWCVTRSDRAGNWSWSEIRDWTDEEWDAEIHPPFMEFAKLTWGEVDQFSSSSGHKMHHSHELWDLREEAQVRWLELGLEQFETLFRFRLGGTKRAWGFIAQAHFFMIWWDRVHAIYPVDE